MERGLELSIISFLLLMAVNSFPGIAEALAAEPNRQENVIGATFRELVLA